MKNHQKHSSGFTLVEIVATIAIIGIMSAFVVSRFIDGDSFNAPVLRDQLISLIRSAQQNSLGRPDVSVTLTPDGAGSTATITTSDDGGNMQSVTVDLGEVSLSGDINITDSCGSTAGSDTISNAAPMTINFGELGDLTDSGVTGSTGAVNSALRICINNDPVASVCVSPSGFAYAGDCDV
ncbi:MAG: prepilin-type N-terminal cleavage/methylation domain-containing protein [Pseudomonadales bacterium]|nr:prepilin-type N-terminal cleavage/methylation domain-containing protein [Pseudomonadales bacterium]